MSYQRPDCHLLPTLLALNPTPMPLLARMPLSCNPSLVRRLRLRPLCLEQAANHFYCIFDVSLQDQPVEQADQGAEIPLEPSRVRQCDHAIVRIEEGHLTSNLLSAPATPFRALHYHCNTVPHHHIHHRVENGGGYQVYLRHAPISFERQPVISSRLRHHPQPTPVCPEEPECSGSHTVSLQDFETHGPVQGVMRLVKFHKYHVQYFLPQGR